MPKGLAENEEEKEVDSGRETGSGPDG